MPISKNGFPQGRTLATVIDPQLRLDEFAGRLSGAELAAVDAALLAVLGLD